MNKEEWENFADQVSSNLQLHHTPLTPTSSESLETIWHKIQTSLITAALKHIPNKRFTVRNFHHTFSAKATQLHYSLKKLGNIIRTVKRLTKSGSPISLHINNTITQLNNIHQLEIPILAPAVQPVADWIVEANSE